MSEIIFLIILIAAVGLTWRAGTTLSRIADDMHDVGHILAQLTRRNASIQRELEEIKGKLES